MPSLPPLTPTANGVQIAASVNALIREYNRPDRKAPIIGTDTGTGAAYAIAPVPGIVQYEVGQEFSFIAAHTNTVDNPTLSVNGLAAGPISVGPGGIAAGSMVKVVVTSTAPTFALVSSTLLQMVSFETGAVATGTTLIPYDDTIPQSTEGDQYMSLAITPKSASSRLEICISAQFTNKGASTNNNVIGALFQDSGANALAASIAGMYTAQAPTQFLLTHVMSSPGTGAYTFKFRAGSQLAGGIVMNGLSGGTRVFGGVCASTMIIREYA